MNTLTAVWVVELPNLLAAVSQKYLLSLSGGARLQGSSYIGDGAAAHGPADNGTLSGSFSYEWRCG